MKVLYATDGLEPAARAAQFLLKVADPTKVEIEVLAVAVHELFVPERESFVLESLEQRRRHATAVAEAEAEVLGEAGFKVSPKICEGTSGGEIVRTAEVDGADLVVVGAGRHNWLGNAILGSTSSFVLHNVRTSVLIVHEVLASEPKVKILIGADGSEGSHHAASLVADLADPERTSVEAMSVMPSPGAGIAFFPVLGAGVTLPDISEAEAKEEETSRIRAENATKRLAGILESKGFRVEQQLGVGNAAEQLLKEADAGSFDLVAMGSRGLGPVRRAFLGSVSDHVARLARAALVARSVS
jgi:nucleotide-binding universal stress UspA family protein